MLIRLTKEVVARHFGADFERLDDSEDPHGGQTPDFREDCLAMSGYLPHCPTYFVTADMVAVAKAAGQTLPLASLGRTVLPSDNGFMIFDAPITTADFDDGAQRVVGITWEHEPASLGHQMPEDYPASIRCTCPEEDMAEDCPYVGVFGEGVNVYPLMLHEGQLLSLGQHHWEFGDDDRDELIVTVNDAVPLGSDKPILATWVLMQQSIVQSEQTRPDRHQRRMCARASIPAELVIVRLRRVDQPERDTDGEAVPWSHRWLVNGHWRRQFYPSDRSNRPLWISPHVKGPQDKPLVVKEKVTAWVR
jgi:hypothetical protein